MRQAWSLAGLAPDETADAAALQGLGSRIASISLTAPLGTAAEPGYAMETPSAVIAAVVSDTVTGPRTVTVTLGAHDEAADSYVAKSSDSDYYVRLAGFQVQDFVDAARDKFVTAAAVAPESPLPPP